MWDTVSGGLQPEPWHHNVIHLTPISQNLAPICTDNSVRVHPYAHPQHMKVLNHCIHIQYGFGMQSVVVYSLNHDTTMSFGPRLTLLFQHLVPTCTDNSVRVHPYGHPQHMKVLKHFLYIQYRCGMQSVVVYSLNHDTTMSYGIHLTPVSQNLAITCTGITV